MDGKIDILKGIHPGVFLARELKKRKLAKSVFALSINEYPQTLSAVLTGHRKMNTSLALRIEEALGLEEGFLMILQAYYDIKVHKARLAEGYHPDLAKFRPAIFWDTKLEKIDWKRQRRAIANRVFERGNLTEKKELMRFYGRKTIEQLLKNEQTNSRAA